MRRTLERRIARWRALDGPNRDVIFTTARRASSIAAVARELEARWNNALERVTGLERRIQGALQHVGGAPKD